MSRFCGGYFDDGQAQIGPVRKGGLYASWREGAKGDRGPSLFMGLHEYRATAATLPSTADEMMRVASAELGVPEDQRENYLWALLLDINGWASWCAYLRWTARLEHRDDSNIRDLLAIRLAWEWILLRAGGKELRGEWHQAMASWPLLDRAAQSARADDWLLQRAVEIAWTSEVRKTLPEGFGATRPNGPSIQAAFCIDVRSGSFFDARSRRRGASRRSAAQASSVCQSSMRRSLPSTGVLNSRGSSRRSIGSPTPGCRGASRASGRSRLYAAQAWKAFKSTALSSFAFVDAMGLFFAADLFGESFGRKSRQVAEHEHAGLEPAEDAARTPRLTGTLDGAPLSLDDRSQLAEGLLRAMSLTRDFARLVVLVGHGAASRNNPYAAGLDCGACSGQTGEVNARAAAALLNEDDVRSALAARGIDVPATTKFVGALHNTTTDDVSLFDERAIASTHARDLADLRVKLDRASTAARRDRAPRLGLEELTDTELRAAVVERAVLLNWAEVRPEWGLAGNAAFIVAPRERTRHLDLAGRSFLHDYRAADDKDFAILEAIMTGPLVVTHWINLQYYASTVDNRRYGSGNKVLHNVVGGHIGVFEGNGGDLRIGLSFQSVNDGERWMHAPLRLAIFIEAPRAAIDRVLEKSAKVAELVANEWLHLFQIDVGERSISMRRNGQWVKGAPD